MDLWLVGAGAILVSTAVIFAYLVFIWWLDRYEREPFWLVLVTFAWGALGATCLGIILSVLLSVPAAEVVPELYSDIFSVVVIAPLAEEFTKGLIFVALLLTPHLDNETDGLIYGAAVGLGFAFVENFLYFAVVAAEAGPEALIAVVVMRTLFTALVHTISSALLGYAIGYVRHRKKLPLLWLLPVAGFALAVVNHGLWNFLAFVSGSGLLSETMSLGTLGLAIALVAVMAVLMFVLTQWSLRREHKIIVRYLEEEAQWGTLPMEHARIIPFWTKRRKKDWLPPTVPHKEYVEAATLLAFRRYQQDTASDRHRARYEQDVQKYRAEVMHYLGTAQQPGGGVWK